MELGEWGSLACIMVEEQQVADSRVPPVTVVPQFNEIENGHGGPGPRLEALSVETSPFKGGQGVSRIALS